ncbi:MAG TPA: hypothetical protein VL096_21615 [Pirellulaceae bacterium]|nr:hypothetical protein [Pirellulaceae bacterium]
MQRFYSLWAIAGIGLAMVSFTGCGDSGAVNQVKVSGKITMDGTPLETGVVSFMPADGKGASAGATIANGQYSALVAPGLKKVSIYAEKVVGQQPRDPQDPAGEKTDVVQQLVPKKYNDNSQLQLDVPATGNNAADFALTK